MSPRTRRRCPACKGVGYRPEQIDRGRHRGPAAQLALCSSCGGSGRWTVP